MSYADIRGLFGSDMHKIVRCLPLIMARNHSLSDCTQHTITTLLNASLPSLHSTTLRSHEFTARWLKENWY